MQLSNLHDALIEQLAGLDNAETELARTLASALPPGARSSRLREAFNEQLAETHGHLRDLEHVRRLEEALAELGVAPPPHGREVVRGRPVADGVEVIETRSDPSALEAALSAAAAQVEHYEVAAYGIARALAGELGYRETTSLLDETLAEKRNANSLLTRLAAGGFPMDEIDRKAAPRS